MPRPRSQTWDSMGRWIGSTLKSLLVLALVSPCGCATVPKTSMKPATAAAPVEQVEMEPLTISVTGQGAERHVESYDAASLFEDAGSALQAERWADAAAGYDRIVKEFPGSRYVRPALYNAGLALEGLRDFAAAAERYRRLADLSGDARDTLDALFRLGACEAELGNWATSAEAFGRLLQHADLSTEDHLEALARRGLAQYNMKDPAAERTFRETVALYKSSSEYERIDDTFYVALAQFYLGELAHDRFRLLPIRLPERQMKQDVEAKVEALLVAQERYVDVGRIKNVPWATAACYQMATLYKELYDALMDAPVPPMNDEMRAVYFEELHKQIEPLLRRAIHMQELTQRVAESNGVDNEWVHKSNEQLARLRALVMSPATSPASATPAPMGPPTPPPIPAPTRPEQDKMQPPSIPPHHNDGPRPIL